MNTLKIEAQLKIEVPKNRSALFKMLSKRPKLSITKVVKFRVSEKSICLESVWWYQGKWLIWIIWIHTINYVCGNTDVKMPRSHNTGENNRGFEKNSTNRSTWQTFKITWNWFLGENFNHRKSQNSAKSSNNR